MVQKARVEERRRCAEIVRSYNIDLEQEFDAVCECGIVSHIKMRTAGLKEFRAHLADVIEENTPVKKGAKKK